jgi:type II secretion system protein N
VPVQGAAAIAERTLGLAGGRRRLAALALAYVALTAVFIAAGFPYARIGPRVAAAIGSATGSQVSIGRLDFALRWLRPVLLANDVELAWPNGQRLHLAHARIGPALSRSWLHGEPAVALALASELGQIEGTATVGRTPGFAGELHGVALDKLPSEAPAPGLRLTGSLDATLDLRLAADGAAEGSVRLGARDGSISPPSLPIGLPFAKLDADLALGGTALLTVKSLTLEGPLVAGNGTGTIGRARSLDTAPLALELHLQARDPGLRQLLIAQGLPLGADGSANLMVSGTLASPGLRPSGAGAQGAPGAAAPRPAGASAAPLPGAPRPLRAPRAPR